MTIVLIILGHKESKANGPVHVHHRHHTISHGKVLGM